MCGCDVLDTQVAVIAGNLELAEIIQNYKPEDIGESFFDGDGEIVVLIERQFNIGQKEETTLFPCSSSLLLWLYYNCFLINQISIDHSILYNHHNNFYSYTQLILTCVETKIV